MSSNEENALSKNNKMKRYFESLSPQDLKNKFMNYMYDELVKNNNNPLNPFLSEIQNYESKTNQEKVMKKKSMAIDIQYAINCVFPDEIFDIALCLIISEYIVSVLPLDGIWNTDFGEMMAFCDMAYYYIDDVERKRKSNCLLFNIKYDHDKDNKHILFARYLEGTTDSSFDFIENNRNNDNPQFFELGHCLLKFVDSNNFVGSFKNTGQCREQYVGHWSGKKLHHIFISPHVFHQGFELNENDEYLLKHANKQINALNLDEDAIKQELIQHVNQKEQ